MHRRLFMIFAALSLLLCLALVVLWVRSYQGPDYLHYTSSGKWHLGLISGHGTLDILYIADWPHDPEVTSGRYDRHVYYGTRYSKRLVGFGGGAQHNGGRFVNIPHWFLVACTGAATVLLIRSIRRGGADRRGHCQACGYDLRATPDRCPECGAVPVKAEHA